MVMQEYSHSTGIPGRCNGSIFTPIVSMTSGGLPFVAGCNGVQMMPGATPLTRMPLDACC